MNRQFLTLAIPAALAILAPVAAFAQARENSSDAVWAPQAYSLPSVGDSSSQATVGLNPYGTVTPPTTPPVVTPPPQPKPATAQWFWDNRMWCITTRTASGWDSIQWQYCEGDACPARERGCYAVYQGGPTSVAAGTPASDYCYSENYCRPR